MKTRIANPIQLLAVCLLTTATTASALQSGDFTYEVNPDGTTVTITDYTGTGGAVAIPPTIDSKDVKIIGSDAFHGCTTLASVQIPDSMSGINLRAFASWELFKIMHRSPKGAERTGGKL